MASRRGTQQQTKAITVGAEGSLLTNYLEIQCYVLSVQRDVFSTEDVDLDAALCDTADPLPFRGSEKWQGDPADEKDTTYKKKTVHKKQTKRKLTQLQVTVHSKSSTMMILFLLPSTELI